MQTKEDSVKHGLSTITLNQLLTAALTGQPYNQRRLGQHLALYALRVSMRRAWWLPIDLHEEIGQEAFADLWQNKATLLANKTAKRAFRDCVVKAARTIQANYAAPGKRTRSYKSNQKDKVAAEQVEYIASFLAVAPGDAADQDSGLNGFPCPTAAAERISVEAKMDVEVVLRSAPSVVRRALELIYFDAMPKQEAAAMLKISRFSLSRKIDTFCETWRQAA